MSYRTRIAGTGSYLPEKVLTNFDIEKLVETTDAWIKERTGIERRHICADDEATTDLALRAANKALESAGITFDQLDMIIFCTVTGDHLMPSSACILQSKLGCKGIPAFDLQAACSGFIYGLSVGDNFIRSGQYKNILLVGAEVIHRYVDYKDRDTCILFGDGAGAVILGRAQPDDHQVVCSTHLGAEGSLADLFFLQAGGSKTPITHELLDRRENFMKMKGREIFKNAVRTMAGACEQAMAFNQLTVEDIDWLIPHQANYRIMEAVAHFFDFPKEKVISIVHEMGNTSAATIPVALDWAFRDGRIKRGQTLLLTAFGAGLTSGSAVVKF